MDLSKEWKYLQKVAKHRLENNKTKNHVSDFGEKIEIMGAAGELAARKFLGLNTNLHDSFDGGVDLVWRGKKIDVKATHLTPKILHRYLQWAQWKECRADLVLMTAVNLKEKQAVVLGFAYAHEIKSAPINALRHTACHEIPVPLLHPAYMLISPVRI